jgi:DNA-binding CsgD family transcriptional regulator
VTADAGPRTRTRTRTRTRLLTRRQSEALTLAANGNTNAQIANRMGRATNTVSGTLTRAYVALGAEDRAQAVAIALCLGLIDPRSVVLPDRVTRADATARALHEHGMDHDSATTADLAPVPAPAA